ncbi:MAG: hypothetical protein ACLGI7_02230 [Gammaproteobacteria bacterium]
MTAEARDAPGHTRYASFAGLLRRPARRIGARLTPHTFLSRPLSVIVVCIVALVVGGSLASPDSAQAFSLNPADWAVDGLKAILKWIFGDVDELAKNIIRFLLGIPLLGDRSEFAQLHAYRDYVVGGAWGILGLSFVISSLRYWLSSYTGAGAYEALLGFAKTVGAIVLLLIFPIGFDQLIRFVNEFTAALITNPIVGQGLGTGIVLTLTNALSPNGGLGLIVGIAALVMAIVLLVVKVIITALLAVLFVLGALAIAVWPIEELSWALRNLVQAVLALLMFPILWAVCFGTFAVLSADTLFSGAGGLSSLLAPLLTLAVLIVAFRLPFVVLRQAMNAGLVPSMGRAMQSAYYVRGLARIGR